MAELCFDRRPRLDPRRVLAAVRQVRPDADLTEADGNLVITYSLLRNMYPDARSAPLLSAITGPVDDTDGRDLSDSRGWTAAARVLGRCRYSLLVIEFLGRDVDSRSRVEAYHAAVLAAVTSTRPLATWWPGSRQAVAPRELTGDPLRGLVNVRTVPDATDPELTVTDTLGLTQLGLPDLQCHYRHLHPERMAGLLRGLAGQLLAGGVPREVRGLTVYQTWPVRPDVALIGPDRATLSIDPGSPFTPQG
jgi:hypothetical protein